MLPVEPGRGAYFGKIFAPCARQPTEHGSRFWQKFGALCTPTILDEVLKNPGKSQRWLCTHVFFRDGASGALRRVPSAVPPGRLSSDDVCDAPHSQGSHGYMVLSNPNTTHTPLSVGIALELMVVAGLQMGCITFTKRRFSSICIANVNITRATRRPGFCSVLSPLWT